MPKGKTKSIPIIKRLQKKVSQAPLTTLSFIIIPVVVIGIAFLKLATGETHLIYVKIKVSQGLWWATTTKPNLWLAKGIKKGDTEYSLLGKPKAEILEVRYYPFFDETQQTEDKYDIYLKVKLIASYDNRREQYTFHRTAIAVGSAIELETQNSQITGTVIEISENEFEDEYVEKTITLIKEEGYFKDNPYQFDNIKIGDSYFDGEDVVFEIIDKQLKKSVVLVPTSYGTLHEQEVASRQNIIIRVKIKARKKDGQLFFGEEKVLNIGSPLIISTTNTKFDKEYIIGEIK
jgi:hypothetical protein